MCRRGMLHGSVLLAFGVGFIVSCFFESSVLCVLIGIAAIVVGICLVCHP